MQKSIDDIDFDHGKLTARENNGNERSINLNANVCKAILRYLLLLTDKHQNLNHRNLWVTDDGKPMTAKSVETMLSMFG